MSAQRLALAGGVLVATLAASVAADDCAELRLALAREEVASRLFHEVETVAAGRAWSDAISRTNAAALLLGLTIQDEAFSAFLEALKLAEIEVDRAGEQAFTLSGIAEGKGGTVPKHLRPIVNGILDASTAIRDAKHVTLIVFCDSRENSR